MKLLFLVVLKHYFITSSATPIHATTPFQIVFSLLWLASGFALWQYATKQRQLTASFAYATIYTLLGFWGYLGAALSQYEFAPTPVITSAPVYVAHWGSVQLMVLCLLFLLLLRADYTRSKWPIGAIALLIPMYLWIALYPLLESVG